jgi:hypothetical protein
MRCAMEVLSRQHKFQRNTQVYPQCNLTLCVRLLLLRAPWGAN